MGNSQTRKKLKINFETLWQQIVLLKEYLNLDLTPREFNDPKLVAEIARLLEKSKKSILAMMDLLSHPDPLQLKIELLKEQIEELKEELVSKIDQMQTAFKTKNQILLNSQQRIKELEEDINELQEDFAEQASSLKDHIIYNQNFIEKLDKEKKILQLKNEELVQYVLKNTEIGSVELEKSISGRVGKLVKMAKLREKSVQVRLGYQDKPQIVDEGDGFRRDFYSEFGFRNRVSRLVNEDLVGTLIAVKNSDSFMMTKFVKGAVLLENRKELFSGSITEKSKFEQD